MKLFDCDRSWSIWSDWRGQIRKGLLTLNLHRQARPARAERLRMLAAEQSSSMAFMEKVGTAFPTDANPSAEKFARHVDNLEGILWKVGIPTTEVAPAVWQRSLGKLPKDKLARKRTIREFMARRYSHLSVTLKTADALGILSWAICRQNKRMKFLTHLHIAATGERKN